MTDIFTLAEALALRLKTIRVANGYYHDVSDNSVFSELKPADHFRPVEGTTYPRIFIVFPGSEYEEAIQGRVHKTSSFLLVTVFGNDYNIPEADRTPENFMPLRIQAMRFEQDIEKWVYRNKQLGGAKIWRLIETGTDSSMVEQEGILYVQLSVEYDSRVND